MQNLHRPVSNSGQWRDTLTIYAAGALDPSTAVFALRACAVDGAPWHCDYGNSRGHRFGSVIGLEASSNDETGRLTVAVNGNSIIVTWLFPPSQMQRLCAGSYEGSIGVQIGDEMSELATFRFVVQERGCGGFAWPVPLPGQPPASGGGSPGAPILFPPRRGQFLAALEASAPGRVSELTAAVPSDPSNAINIAFVHTVFVDRLGFLAQFAKATLALTDEDLDTIIANARMLTE